MPKPRGQRAPETTEVTGSTERTEPVAPTPPAPAPAPEPHPETPEVTDARPAPPEGWLWCRALRTVLARGMPAYKGDCFYMPAADAGAMQERGDVEIL